MNMGIYIKGMEMPKNCFDCPLFDDVYTDADGDDDYCCALGVPLDYYQASGETKKDCPLVHVPPHGKLKDADAIERNLLKMQQAQIGQYSHGVRKSRAVLRDAPTVIPAEPEEEEMK